MYDKVIVDTIHFNNYKLDFIDENIFCLKDDNHIDTQYSYPDEFNSLLNLCESTIDLGNNLWKILDSISFSDDENIYSNLPAQIKNSPEAQNFILTWIKKYGLTKYNIDDDERDYEDPQYKELDDLLQKTAKRFFNIKKDIRLPISFKTNINGIQPEYYEKIYSLHKWNITNIITVSLTMSAIYNIKNTLYKTVIGNTIDIINASSILKKEYNEMINISNRNYTKKFGKLLYDFADNLFFQINNYIDKNIKEKNTIDIEFNKNLDLNIDKKTKYKLFNNNYILRNPIIGAYEYFIPMILNQKLSDKKERYCDKCGQKLIYSGRLCVKCKKIIGGELIKANKISENKMITVKDEMDLLRINIIPKTHIIDDIYYQRLRSEKNYYNNKKSE